MRYLITGSTGFIGPYLVNKLVSQGHLCRCLVRSALKAKAMLGSGVELIEGDVTVEDSLKGIASGMDVIFHLATLGHMHNFKVHQGMFDQVNVQGTINIMNEALKAGIQKFVHCSSVAAMGISRDIPADEDSECLPHHPYGKSKLRAEKEVLELVHNRNLPAVIVRFSMVYGPGDSRDILKLTRLAKKGLFPKIGNRPKLTPLIYIDDAIEGLLLAAQKGRAGEIYIITNQESLPFDEIRKILQMVLGIKNAPIYMPERVALSLASLSERLFPLIGKVPPVARKDIESTLADRIFSIEKAKRELDFMPRVAPVEGLKKTVEWYKQEGWV